ncbi:Gfo/Idh/MocA family protein [Microlunatus parietis]|uniref:Putative dehydrogenase n=1 Tax=Microlunatus parietis TaxID=682979 RepID=A0A7Y9LFD1_9ACTN|nr:Gfo/Idh/MocA family oxidoreductase [Microlunatus parietis]NYE74728.1 putative dehydrogenase [Microlunatus parietis]
MINSTGPLRVGLLGAGGIAVASYGVLPNLHHYADTIEVVALADVDHARAAAVAQQYGIPRVYATVEELVGAGGLDAVVNLTPIPVHYATSKVILEHGLHLVTEKPIAATLAEADELIMLAESRGLVIVSAPPDLLRTPIKRARELVAACEIGRIAFARVHSSHQGPGGGPGGWPTDPTWFYQRGSGPLLDMGVYGIHQITGILGPARRVVAFSGITDPVRVVRGGPFAGLEIEVTADDNTLFLLDFGGSTYAVVDGSYNLHASRSPRLELFGRRGVINLGVPGGPELEVFKTDLLPGVDGWIDPSWPLAADTNSATTGRAVIVGHLADIVLSGAPNELGADHARHALEIMLAVETSAREGRIVELRTTFRQPTELP